MFDGSYVIFIPDHLPPPNVQTPWAIGDADDDVIKNAYKHVLQVSTVTDVCVSLFLLFSRCLHGQVVVLRRWLGVFVSLVSRTCARSQGRVCGRVCVCARVLVCVCVCTCMCICI